MPSRRRIVLAFVGRLCREKGFDDLLRVFARLRGSGRYDPVLLVAGSGPLESELDHAEGVLDARAVPFDAVFPRLREPSGIGGDIVFLSWRSPAEVREIFAAADYAVIPSRFVETFGLVALEALSAGATPIWSDTGGLGAFVDATARVDFSESADVVSARLERVFETVPTDAGRRAANRNGVARYSPEAWIERVNAMLPRRSSRVLLVSDYDAPVGGTEAHVGAVADSLRSAGHEVRVLGKKPRLPLSRLDKMRDMLGTFTRGWGRAEAVRTLADFRPDVVWTHAVTKVYDFATLAKIAAFPAEHWHTYHDFSLMTPFAADMRSIADVPIRWTLADFLAVLDGGGMPRRLYARAKFSKLSRLHGLLRRYDRHFVPSDFLAEPVSRLVGISPERIETLPHFIKK